MLPSPSPLPSSRENFLDKKIELLDRRLTLIEKFVENRFQKAFHSFVVLDDDHELDGGIGASSEDKECTNFQKKESFSQGQISQDFLSTQQMKKLAERSKKDESQVIVIPKRSTRISEQSKKSRSQTERGARTDKVIETGSYQQDEKVLEVVANIKHKVKRKKTRQHTNIEDGDAKEDVDGNNSISNNLSSMETQNLHILTLLQTTTGIHGKSILSEDASTSETRRRGRKIKVGKSKNMPSKFKVKQGKSPPKKRIYIPAISADVPPGSFEADPSRQKCDICHMHIKLEHYKNHIDSHVKERHLKCPHCDKTYFNQSMLRKHMRVHQPEKYGKKCRLCGKFFLQSDKHLAHERFCVKKKLQKKEYVDPEIIQNIKNRSPGWVLSTSDEDPQEKKECPLCLKWVKGSFYYTHLKMHTTTKEWMCKLCEKAYYHKHDLVRHFAMEHAPLCCRGCAMTFNDKAQLKSHGIDCNKGFHPERDIIKAEDFLDNANTPTTLGTTVSLVGDEELEIESNIDAPMVDQQFSLVLVEDTNVDMT